jgi:hypothetical protein
MLYRLYYIDYLNRFCEHLIIAYSDRETKLKANAFLCLDTFMTAELCRNDKTKTIIDKW